MCAVHQSTGREGVCCTQSVRGPTTPPPPRSRPQAGPNHSYPPPPLALPRRPANTTANQGSKSAPQITPPSSPPLQASQHHGQPGLQVRPSDLHRHGLRGWLDGSVLHGRLPQHHLVERDAQHLLLPDLPFQVSGGPRVRGGRGCVLLGRGGAPALGPGPEPGVLLTYKAMTHLLLSGYRGGPSANP